VQITCVHASKHGLREGHPSHSGHSAQNDGGVVVSGSDDKTVRVWNAASGNVLKIVGEHGGPLSCVLMQPGRIISACFDGKVRFIDILTGSCIRTVAGHRNAVMSIDAKGSIVISGGNDRDLRVSFYSPFYSLTFSLLLSANHRHICVVVELLQRNMCITPGWKKALILNLHPALGK